MLGAMERARARSAAIEADLARVNKQLRNERRKRKRQSCVPGALWRVATVIFALTHPDVEHAATFLEQKWTPGKMKGQTFYLV